MPFLHLVKKGGVIVWNFFLQILLEITKTIAREGIVMGFKKLTAKKAQKRRPPVCLRSVGSLLSANKL